MFNTLCLCRQNTPTEQYQPITNLHHRRRKTHIREVGLPGPRAERSSNQENPGFSRFPPTFDLDLSSDLLPSELVLLAPGSTGPQDFRNSGLDRTIPLYHTVRCCSVFCVLCSVRTYVQYCTVVYFAVLQYLHSCRVTKSTDKEI